MIEKHMQRVGKNGNDPVTFSDLLALRAATDAADAAEHQAIEERYRAARKLEEDAGAGGTSSPEGTGEAPPAP